MESKDSRPLKPWEIVTKTKSNINNDANLEHDIHEIDTINNTPLIEHTPNPAHITASMGVGLGYSNGNSVSTSLESRSLPLSQNSITGPQQTPYTISQPNQSNMTSNMTTQLDNTQASIQRYSNLVSMMTQSTQSLLSNIINLIQKLVMLKIELSHILKSFAVIRLGWSISSRVFVFIRKLFLFFSRSLFPFRRNSMNTAWSRATLHMKNEGYSGASSLLPSIDMLSIASASIVGLVIFALANYTDNSKKNSSTTEVDTPQLEEVYNTIFLTEQ